ncbi:glutathione S-transferase N-terminal domain-containing protein [Limnobacter sp.]|uniref:glutathione S-transferase N-terminal domain-containing protein n=1 Tax=Limnobacter sp. TaxID=2003368 RepID=UPI0025842A95|nr:glutathione S-transferase N-terminal domain-containing protein [Limnobacter sp.]
MSTQVDAVVNLFAGTVRGWRGTAVRGRARKTPEKLLKLYDIEASPFCRLVREALSEMDLDVLILPCPAGGTRFRPQAKALLKNTTFPMLVDENTGEMMNESAHIIDYLARTYEGGVQAQKGPFRGLAVGTSVLSTLFGLRSHGLSGLKARPSREPAQPLELFSFESSPFSKPVRARLCELELPYVLRNTAKGAMSDMGPPSFRDKLFKGPKGTTRNRALLFEKTGKVQVPYLIDPNTGVEMYESQAILNYLDQTYAVR